VVTVRSYNQFCGIAKALDLVGERWALLVVRDLLLGPRRFSDLRRSLPGIGSNVLTTRLRELETAGVVRRRDLPPPAASAVYELTEYGRDLEPILLSLGRWGARSLGSRTRDQALRSEWLAVALRAYFSPDAAAGVDAAVELRLSHSEFVLRIADGALQVAAGADGAADLRLETDEETLIGFLAGAGVPEDAVRPDGDRALLRRLPQLFPFGRGPEIAPELDAGKRAAAEAAAELVEQRMAVGLGTGSTVGFLLPALAARGLSIRCVATSLRTEDAARRLGLRVEPFDSLGRLDIAIDGADQIAPDGWLVKGGGAAHTRRCRSSCSRSGWRRRFERSAPRRCGARRRARTAA
jgi:DNA-binding HxlR family transcriptional regulator